MDSYVVGPTQARRSGKILGCSRRSYFVSASGRDVVGVATERQSRRLERRNTEASSRQRSRGMSGRRRVGVEVRHEPMEEEVHDLLLCIIDLAWYYIYI